MPAIRDNGMPRPADGRTRRTKPRSEVGAAPKHNGAAPLLIKVQCPNPACGKVHAIKSRWAGRTGSCPKCGTIISVPNSAAPRTGDRTSPALSSTLKEGNNRAAEANGAAQLREDVLRPGGAELSEVRAGCIGRGHAGKTALIRALGEGVVGDFFPSGLHVDVGDPREVALMIREAEQTQHLLELSGLPPTLLASQIRYYLYDGDEQRVVYKMHEVIGQVLTHTFPDSAPEQQIHYSGYLKSLVNTHVLWTLVPCPPPNPGPRERRRFANDLRITLAYLREALRLRSLEQPVAVALVLSKIDTLFEDAEEARASLTDDVLCKALGPLVHLIDQSPRVSDAAIIPVTSFGFGNGVLRESGGERAGAPAESANDPLGAEPIWLLRDGAALQPFNLDTLFLWTLLFGLLNQAGHGVTETESEIGEICRTLREDLDATDPWLLPLKSGTVREEKRALLKGTSR